MGSYFINGIILRHQDFREADRLLTIYSREFGRIEAVARSSRKISSKLAGSLEPFLVTECMVIRGKRYDTIASSTVARDYKNIKGNLHQLAIAEYLAQLVVTTAKERQADEKIFALLCTVMEALDKNSNKYYPYLVWYFVWNYLKYLGYEPELYHCVNCKKSIRPGNNTFSFQRGGLVCSRCGHGIQNGQNISDASIKLMRFILEHPPEKLRSVAITKPMITALNKITAGYWQYTQERDWPIKDFLSLL